MNVERLENGYRITGIRKGRPEQSLLLTGRTVRWHDAVLGPREAKLPAVSDPVVVRADGTPNPLFASVVDDIDTGITHIVRGEDNAANTGIQIDLFEALGTDPSRIAIADRKSTRLNSSH